MVSFYRLAITQYAISSYPEQVTNRSQASPIKPAYTPSLGLIPCQMCWYEFLSVEQKYDFNHVLP